MLMKDMMLSQRPDIARPLARVVYARTWAEDVSWLKGRIHGRGGDMGWDRLTSEGYKAWQGVQTNANAKRNIYTKEIPVRPR